MRALAEPFAERFAADATAHLATQFVSLAASLGDTAFRACIDHGIARAAHHGIDDNNDVLEYLALQCLFGRDFDTALPWAAQALGAQGNGAVRLGRLRVLALAHAPTGRDTPHALEAPRG